MLPRTLFSEEHELYREQVRKFVEREIAPHHAQWEKDQHRAALRLACGWRGRAAFARNPRRVWRLRRRQASFRDRDGGAGARWRYRAWLFAAFGYRRALHPGLWHRGAEAPLSAAHGEGRDHRRHRHDGAGRRLRFAGRADNGACGAAMAMCSTARRPLSPTARTPMW